MLDTSIKVHTDTFDGPLALLLLLVQKNELSVNNINLTEVTKQYLDYLAKMKELDFDVAGEYLHLAASLLLIKSKESLTEEEVQNLEKALGDRAGLDVRREADLIKRLEELKHFQQMGKKLWDTTKLGHEVFVRPKVNRKDLVNSILVPMEVGKLIEAMTEFLSKDRKKYTVVKRDRLSIKEKLITLKKHLKQGEKHNFETLVALDGDRTIENIVITFISLLEMARMRRLEILPDEEKPGFEVFVKESLEDFDVDSANGFDDPNEQEQTGITNEELQASIVNAKESEETVVDDNLMETSGSAAYLQ